MVRPRSGPSLKKLMLLTAVLLAVVMVYRTMSSMELDLLSKDSHNRIHYEKLYTEVSDEVADWRQRYDTELSKVEQHLNSLTKAEQEVQRLREENDNLKAEVLQLKGQLKRSEPLQKR